MERPVVVEELTKSFRTPVKSPGFAGTIKGLVKPTYNETTAVDKVSFSIDQGEFVGFLGPNGAGKTTTIKILSGILHPTSGKALVYGQTPFERHPEMLRQIALVMGNRQQLWWDLPAWESFVVLREIYGVPQSEFKSRIDELVEALNLADKLQTQVRKLSLGERMKCELVAALIHSPRVVFLDEPTIGLDLMSQKNIRAFLKTYNQTTGATVILTSHYMQDVEELCKRVIIINHGKKVYDGALAELTTQYASHRKLNFTFSETIDPQTLQPFGQIIDSEEASITLEVPVAESSRIIAQILAQFPVQDLSIAETEVEDVIQKVFELPTDNQTEAAAPASP